MADCGHVVCRLCMARRWYNERQTCVFCRQPLHLSLKSFDAG